MEFFIKSFDTTGRVGIVWGPFESAGDAADYFDAAGFAYVADPTERSGGFMIVDEVGADFTPDSIKDLVFYPNL
jgi:hypothetical protein